MTMRILLTSLALASAMAVPAFAEETQPAAPPGSGAAWSGPSAQQMAAMRQLHDRMRQMHERARAQMLSALTPAHREAISGIIGRNAVASNPDPAAAAAQIDALLGANEKSAVISVAQNLRASTRSLMQSARVQMEAQMPADVRARMQQHEAAHIAERAREGSARQPDAGRILLHLGAGAGKFGGSEMHEEFEGRR